MANTINWGKIYEKTAWGIGIINNISWGKIYANLAGSIPSFALNFATISDDFTFTRSSFATRVNEFGLIETVTDLGSELVQNGDFEELGSELVTNGDFDTDSDWTLLNGATISNGQLNIDYNLGNGSTTQTNVFTIGKTYKIEINVDNSSTGSVRIGGGVSPTVLSNGLNTFYLEAVGTAIEIRNHVNFVGSIDNISIKQVDPNDEWSLGASWSIEDGKAISDGSQTGNSLLQQASILTLNKLYKVSYDLTVDSGTIYVRLGFSGQGAVRATSGSYTEYVTCSGNTNFDFLATSTYSGSVDNVSIQEVLEDDVPRIDYTNGEAEFLLEPQSTNLITYSEDFTQWNKSNSITVTSNAINSPSGELNASLLTTTTTNRFIYLSVSSTANSTFSIYVKWKNGSGDIDLSVDGASNYTSVSVTSEWTRVSITPSSSITQVVLRIPTASELYVWGAQVEALSYATSYIPTNGSTVTRAQETCVDATPTINSEEGVLYFEGSTLVNGVHNRYIGISNGTSSNRVQVIFSGASNRITASGVKGGVTLGSIAYTSYIQTDNNKFAIVYSVLGIKLFVNGVEVGDIVADASFPADTLTDFDFSTWNSVDSPFYGNTKDLKIYDKALTDDELTLLTSL